MLQTIVLSVRYVSLLLHMFRIIVLSLRYVSFPFVNISTFNKVHMLNLQHFVVYLGQYINFPPWLIFIRLIIANDVETNPGDFANCFFNFCNWNLNSLAKDDFSRVELLEAHNSVYNSDIISVDEACLNASVELSDTMSENYTFVACNNPLIPEELV